MKVIHHYNLAELPLDSNRIRGGSARRISKGGRTGLHLAGIKSRLLIPRHTVNSPTGSLTLWVMSLDDLAPAIELPQHKVSNRFSEVYAFLSDREAVQSFAAASFHFSLHTHWHPMLMAKFGKGTLHELVMRAERKALATANYFEMERLQWYQFTVTWNRPEGRYAVYANGILIATEDQTIPRPLHQDPCGEFLFLGNPALVYSDLSFYDYVLSPSEVEATFTRTAVEPSARLQRILRARHAGAEIAPFDAGEAAEWSEQLHLPLNRSEDLEQFYQQGSTTSTRITPEGLRVTTPPLEELYRYRLNDEYAEIEDTTRMYLWTNRVFEGDLYLKFDFKVLQRGGLCLLMTNAAGMQGEDFLREYPLRTNGLMRTVCWEDVRNYHWEFFRDILEARNDLPTHVMAKNPWYRPIGFRTEDQPWNLEVWHTLEYLQEGGHIIGAIDGRKVIETDDRRFENSGPILRNGRICLRCMMRTDILFRNLTVRTNRDFDVL